jgi:hypothetical protein
MNYKLILPSRHQMFAPFLDNPVQFYWMTGTGYVCLLWPLRLTPKPWKRA